MVLKLNAGGWAPAHSLGRFACAYLFVCARSIFEVVGCLGGKLSRWSGVEVVSCRGVRLSSFDCIGRTRYLNYRHWMRLLSQRASRQRRQRRGLPHIACCWCMLRVTFQRGDISCRSRQLCVTVLRSCAVGCSRCGWLTKMKNGCGVLCMKNGCEALCMQWSRLLSDAPLRGSSLINDAKCLHLPTGFAASH